MTGVHGRGGGRAEEAAAAAGVGTSMEEDSAEADDGDDGGVHDAEASCSSSESGADDDLDDQAHDGRLRARFQSAAAAAADDLSIESNGFDLEGLSVLVDWGTDGVFAGKVARYATRPRPGSSATKMARRCVFWGVIACSLQPVAPWSAALVSSLPNRPPPPLPAGVGRIQC